MTSTSEIKRQIKTISDKVVCLNLRINDLNPSFARYTNYDAFPPAASVPDSVVIAENSQGVPYIPSWIPFVGTYYPKGFYYSNGIDWVYAGNFPFQASQTGVNEGEISDQFVTPLTLKGSSQWGTKANTSHTHSTSDINNLQQAISSNADVVANTEKLASIEEGAQVNVVPDWENIENKPTTFEPSSHNHIAYESMGFGVMNGEVVIPVGIKAISRAKNDGIVVACRLESFDNSGNLISGTVNISIFKNNLLFGNIGLNNQTTIYNNSLIGWESSFVSDDRFYYEIINNTDVTNLILTIYYSIKIQ